MTTIADKIMLAKKSDETLPETIDRLGFEWSEYHVDIPENGDEDKGPFVWTFEDDSTITQKTDGTCDW